jgi:hypothetical protein
MPFSTLHHSRNFFFMYEQVRDKMPLLCKKCLFVYYALTNAMTSRFSHGCEFMLKMKFVNIDDEYSCFSSHHVPLACAVNIRLLRMPFV